MCTKGVEAFYLTASVPHVDVFISHNWGAGCWAKYLALCQYLNLGMAVKANLFMNKFQIRVRLPRRSKSTYIYIYRCSNTTECTIIFIHFGFVAVSVSAGLSEGGGTRFSQCYLLPPLKFEQYAKATCKRHRASCVTVMENRDP